MMASFMSYFGARRDPKQSARDAIVGLRQQLQMLEKKEEYLQKKIDEEVHKAKANAVTNKAGVYTLVPTPVKPLTKRPLVLLALSCDCGEISYGCNPAIAVKRPSIDGNSHDTYGYEQLQWPP
jgi:hypothetical protein